MHVHRFTLRAALAAGAAAGLVAACGGGGSAEPGAGTLRLALTDAPACGYDAVHVTVDRVRVHQSAEAGEGDGGWSEIVLPAPRRIDLLTLTNGALEELGQTALPAGRYTQMRLLLAANKAADPLANAVTPTGLDEVPLDTPSGSQSGLKMNVDIAVAAGQMADFVIDFDACKSVVPRGRSGRHNLKPVLRVMPRLAAAGARVVGYLDPALAGATVSVQMNGAPVLSTVPDPRSGRFDLYPVAPGSYTLVNAGAGRATGVITGVPVTADAYTFVNAPTAPILLPPGAPRSVQAGVTARPDDTVLLRALQTLTGGPMVEVLARLAAPDGTPVDLALASVAPMVAPYAAGAAAVPFTADAALNVVGQYTVQVLVTPPAPALPLPPVSEPLDVSAAVPDPLPSLAFSFP